MGHKNQIAPDDRRQISFKREAFTITSHYFTPGAYKQINIQELPYL
jgi:hypothetical protein